MKKKIIVPVTIVIVLLLVLLLFLPIPLGSFDDGGTRIYVSLTYTIVKWNRDVYDQDGVDTYTNTSVYWIPDCYKSIDELWEMEYNND